MIDPHELIEQMELTLTDAHTMGPLTWQLEDWLRVKETQ